MTWQFDTNTVIVIAVQLIALVSAYYGLKADNAKTRSDLALQMSEERNERTSTQNLLRSDLMTLIGKVEKAISDLGHRVGTLESGQDSWTQSLRERTHQLADQVQALVLKVDRLERPTHYTEGDKG